MLKKKYNQKFGLFVDVFPLDGLPNNSNREAGKFFIHRKNFYLKLFCVQHYNGKRYKFLKFISSIILPIIPHKYLSKKIDRIVKKYDYEKSKKCICVWGKSIYNTEDFKESIPHKFESLIVNVPKNYDNYLTTCYGDYMKLPPEDQRVTHELIVTPKV